MKIKGIVEEDFVNYKKPSLFIGFPHCSFKCCTQGGFDISVCQNSKLATQPDVDVSCEYIYKRYIDNEITHSLVFGGMEPMDSFDDVFSLVKLFRENGCNDDIVIYTGYYPYEIAVPLTKLSAYDNIIIKFGRYVPNNAPHYDDVLGVNLSSDNQYATKIGGLIRKNEDARPVESAIRENDGYCVCHLLQTNDTKCICRDFICQEIGSCHCGLYEKIKI